MARKRKVTDEFFNTAKFFLEKGKKKAEVAEIMECSEETITRISKAKTIEEYIEIRRFETEPRKETKDSEQTIRIQAHQYMSEKQDKVIELLTVMSNKMTHIYETLDEMLKIWEGESNG